ncbi:MAG: glycerol-3-phosphate 1-O-acyltransferase PlsY [Gemmatimonadaceae bacterium]
MHPALALGIAYLAGSFPSAYLAGRVLRGVDLRTIGSGNLGATNVYRNLGSGAAAGVLAVDALKGFLPVLLLPATLPASVAPSSTSLLWWGLAFGVAAIAGHAKPIFLLGKGGGKGVATASGVFLALAPAALGVALLAFVITAWRTGFVSLASIISALVLPFAVAITLGGRTPLFFASLAIGAFVIWSHRANIARLRQGTEPRTFRRTTA